MELTEQNISDEQKQLVEKFANFVVARNLSTPALVFLESVKPLNIIASEALYFFSPLVSVFFDTAFIDTFAKFLQSRNSTELLANRIEQLENMRYKNSQNKHTTHKHELKGGNENSYDS
jgi:hypothetical protein